MKKKPSLPLLLFLLLIVHLSGEEQIILGREDQWRDSWTQNIILKKGWEGFWDLNVLGSVYHPDSQTDLLLSFDDDTLSDATGNYLLEEPANLTEYQYRRGRSAAVLREGRPLVLYPGEDSLFSGNREWYDFSFEFQLYPALLQEGEILFHWKGLYRQTADGEQGIFPQEIICRVTRRRLEWTFKNFFIDQNIKSSNFVLTGDRLVPRSWNHHMVRYDSDLGLLEYLIDGEPSDILYTTPSRREEEDLFHPTINQSSPTPLKVGTDFTGFIDEFRISRHYVEKPQLDDFQDKGVYLSPLIDLYYQDSTLTSIGGVDNIPENSYLYYYYAISDRKEDMENLRRSFSSGHFDFKDPRWQPFKRGDALDNAKGRYLLIGSELYPDLGAGRSPSVSEFRISYIPELPPIAPLNLKAEGRDGTIHLSWDYWKQEGIGGFLLYYGDRPGRYFGEESPILLPADENSYELSGLESQKLWYFSLVAFSDSQPAQYSPFSEEASARP